MTPAIDARLPLAKLLPLSLAAFVTILTEALPAGLLAQMAQGLGVSPSAVGQTVTAYAAGSLLAAIPLVAVTQRLRRRPLLLTAIAGFVVTNAFTALSHSYALTLVARFIAGVSAGLIWALLAGYAARMVPEHRKGAAIAVAMAGTPLALSLGVPAGTLLGTWTGWRAAFCVMSVLAVALLVWVRAIVPDFAGQTQEKTQEKTQTQRPASRSALSLPGVRAVLLVVLTFVLAHNLLYTYIASFLATADMCDSIDRVLLTFGIASLFGILIVGVGIDRHLRTLTLASTLLFAVATLMLARAGHAQTLVYASVAAWGLAFGGAATLFQTALAHAAGEATDAAQAVLVTVWNAAIAGGGMIGGVLLDRFSIAAFFPVLLGLLGVTFVTVWLAKSTGFPARHPQNPTEPAHAERSSQ
ncbi:MAG: MFS transporter [Paraburkholderia tropica]|uniref:MFS family arabinose efflux permease n=1 Tax=Paraburkholderia tropica TaxID=92647 RepID=A0ABX5MSZ3_9BURK|nr:MFS transporter [Paraburkholderia tropica]MDE1144669.1 MFS transporter [Paraburkholderia tropica]PXX17559.1 putative MFS family arabinose efflux permease [Paraburkholderia tropica]PZW84741.1 putative MFS family arabinose efflux permease [Paraburkholderia tropica]